MNPDESLRRGLLFIRDDLDYEEVEETNEFEEMQLYELLLDGLTWLSQQYIESRRCAVKAITNLTPPK